MSHTAGTPGDGYRCEPTPHPFRLDRRDDYGRRATCADCGGERFEHEQPARRTAA